VTQEKQSFNGPLGIILFTVFLLGGAFIVPWKNVNWGKLTLSPASTITVSGRAETKQRSQVASFTAGVSVTKDDKTEAVNEVNSKIETILEDVKDFGIDGDDLKTQNINISQMDERYYDEGVQKSRPGQWRVSNNVVITLRDVDKASDLADLLSQSGATNVYGPNFRVEDTQEAETGLMKDAVDNAREKAEELAEASGSTLGKVISVTEGTSTTPIFRTLEAGGGGGAPIEPGSSSVAKTVTVIFELK